MTEPHLTDEQLSAHLDGSWAEPGDGASAAAHLAGCAACGARWADLDLARTLVGTPVPPVAPEVRAASISAVMRRAGEERRDDPGAAPVPLRTRRGPQVLLGTAAAVLVLAVAIGIPLALHTTSSSSHSSTASPVPRSTSATVREPAPHRQPTGSASSGRYDLSAGATSVADLGAVSSASMLRSAVAALSVGGVRKPATVPAAPSTTSESDALGVPATTGATKSTNAPSGAGTPDTSARCLPAARRAAMGRPRPVTLLATADYKGTPALVYVLGPVARSTTGDGARSVAVAVKTAGNACRVLVTTPL